MTANPMERTPSVIMTEPTSATPGRPVRDELPAWDDEATAGDDEATDDVAQPVDHDVDRLTVIWRAKFLIVTAAVLVGALVYVGSNQLTPVYTSSATIVVTAASTPGGSAQDVALASNDLAAQDAQLVTADAVITTAAARVHVPGSTLSKHVSAGTVNAQNVVQVTVQSSNKSSAQQWANAVAQAFQAYIGLRAQVNSQALRNSVNLQAAPLDQQIAQLRSQIASAPPAAPGTEELATIQSMQGQLTQLMASRATLEENTALAIASESPNISIPTAATSATKVSPRPSLYAIVAVLLTVLVASQIAIVVARRRSTTTTPT